MANCQHNDTLTHQIDINIAAGYTNRWNVNIDICVNWRRKRKIQALLNEIMILQELVSNPNGAANTNTRLNWHQKCLMKQ